MCTLGLCRQMEIASSCQGNDGCGHDDGHGRKIHGHIVDRHGLSILQVHTGSAGHTRADAAMPGMKNYRQPGLSKHFI